MKTLQDKRNGNIYTIGSINGERYLYNRVMRFKATDVRLNNLKEITLNEYDTEELIKDIKETNKNDFARIIFE